MKVQREKLAKWLEGGGAEPREHLLLERSGAVRNGLNWYLVELADKSHFVNFQNVLLLSQSYEPSF